MSLPLFQLEVFYTALATSGLFFIATLGTGLLIFKARSLVKTYALAMAVGAVAFVVRLVVSSSPTAWGDLVAWAILGGTFYLCATYLFFHFLNIPLSSVRLQILERLRRGEDLELEAPKGPTTLELRIERLESSGQIALGSDGRYRLGQTTPWMLSICWCFDFLRRTLALGAR